MKNNPVKQTPSGCAFFGRNFTSQVEAAEYFGLSKTMINLILKGEREPSKDMAQMCGYRKIVDKKRTVRYERIE